MDLSVLLFVSIVFGLPSASVDDTFSRLKRGGAKQRYGFCSGSDGAALNCPFSFLIFLFLHGPFMSGAANFGKIVGKGYDQIKGRKCFIVTSRSKTCT